MRVYAVAEQADVLEEGDVPAEQLSVDRHHNRPDPHLYRTKRVSEHVLWPQSGLLAVHE